MAAARPQVSVYDKEGKAVGELPLPAVLTVSGRETHVIQVSKVYVGVYVCSLHVSAVMVHQVELPLGSESLKEMTK